MTAEWREFDSAALFPQELADLMGVVASTADVVATAAETLATAAELAAVFAQDFADAQAAIVQALREQVYQVIQQLNSTDVYLTFHLPVSITHRLPPGQWLSDVALSFDDYMDANRPMMPTPAFVSVIALVSTAGDYGLLLSKLKYLWALLKKFISPDFQRSRWPLPKDPFKVIPGVGAAPNWSRTNLKNVIPPIGKITDKLEAFVKILNTAERGVLQTFADFLKDKAKILRDFSNTLQSLLDDLLSILDMPSMHMLTIYGEYTGDELKRLIQGTSGGPASDPDAAYTGGIVFLATGGTSSPTSADALMSLFGAN
jgi:hypothetical protein